ncbi:hypothetical protein GCM10027348_14080 [Hymenobacter tenuis]
MLQVAAANVGQHEATGRNDGPFVERCLKVVGLGKGNPWCGAFLAWVWKSCGLKFPAGAGGARNWFADAKRTFYKRGVRGAPALAKPGDVVGFYYQPLGRIGHIAVIEKVTPTGFITIEGNTGGSGSREGEGVHRLRRSRNSIYSAANWIE